MKFHEIVSIGMEAGYGSIFGDGKVVQIDLCQQCLKLIFASLTVWVASSGEVSGLATEATTVEAMATKPTDLVPLLLEANECTANAATLIELIARRLSVTNVGG